MGMLYFNQIMIIDGVCMSSYYHIYSTIVFSVDSAVFLVLSMDTYAVIIPILVINKQNNKHYIHVSILTST